METKLQLLSRELTPVMKEFADKYALTLNATQAVRDTPGITTKHPQVAASRLMANEKVQAYIQELRREQQEKLGISQDRVLQELARMAYVDPGEMYDEFGCLKPINEMPEDVRRAIASVETKEIFEQDGKKKKYVGDNKKVLLTAKEKALEMLARHLGMFEKDNKQSATNIIIVSAEESTKIWQSLQSEF